MLNECLCGTNTYQKSYNIYIIYKKIIYNVVLLRRTSMNL